MRIAFRTHDLGVRGLEALIKKCKECSVSAVQLVAYKVFDEVKYAPLAFTKQKAEWIGNAFKEAGIDVSLVGAYFNPVHSNKQKVADCVEVFKEYLTFVKELGANIVGSETGSFNDDKWTYNPLNRTDEALNTVISTFGSLARYAKDMGVNIGMEGAAGHVCYDVATLKRAVDAINLDNVKVIFDIYNFLDTSNYQNYLEIFDEGLKTFGDKIVVFHMKDFIIVDGKIKQVAPGKGQFDYPLLLKKIKAHNEDAVLVLEGTTGDDIIPSINYINEIWAKI